MRRFALLVLLAALATAGAFVAAGGPAAAARWWHVRELRGYVGQAIPGLSPDDGARARALVASLLPPGEPKLYPFRPEPRLVRRTGGARPRLIVLCLSHGPTPYAAIHVLDDSSGAHLAATELSLGYHVDVAAAELRIDEVIPGPALVIDCTPQPEAPPIARQVYSIADDGAALLRVETKLGAAAPAEDGQHRAIGPAPPDWPAETYAREVGSTDVRRVLRALVALTTRRAPRSPELRAAIEPLTRSPEPWVAEAAVLALARQDAEDGGR